MSAWYHLTTVFPVLIGCIFCPLLSPLIPSTAMQRCRTGDAEGSEDAARAHGVQRQGDGVWQYVQLLRVGLCERGCRCDSVPACATLSVRVFDDSCLWVDCSHDLPYIIPPHACVSPSGTRSATVEVDSPLLACGLHRHLWAALLPHRLRRCVLSCQLCCALFVSVTRALDARWCGGSEPPPFLQGFAGDRTFALCLAAGASGAEESKSVSETSHGTVSTAMRHKELLTRVIPVLAFLAKHERLDQHHVMLLWDMAMPVLPASTGSAGDAEGAGTGAGAPVAAVPTSAVHSDDQVGMKGLDDRARCCCSCHCNWFGSVVVAGIAVDCRCCCFVYTLLCLSSPSNLVLRTWPSRPSRPWWPSCRWRCWSRCTQGEGDPLTPCSGDTSMACGSVWPPSALQAQRGCHHGRHIVGWAVVVRCGHVSS